MSKLERRVIAAAAAAIAKQKYVAPLDVLTGIGWLTPRSVEAWRQGRVDCLEEMLSAEPSRRADVLEYLRRWAESGGLLAEEAAYLSAARDRRELRFTPAASPSAELAYRTHWVSASLSPAQRERLAEKQNQAPDLVVHMPLYDWFCMTCKGTGDFQMLDEAGAICLTCADLDHLVFLPAGDAALTRRAKKASALSAVVVRRNPKRNRHERQGVLVTESALQTAEAQCLADEDARQRRRVRDQAHRASQDLVFQAEVAALISRLYPACPPHRAEAISEHTTARNSGRVGRSAAARALDEQAITRAVIASIRHEDTPYDALLMSGVPRQEARHQIRETVDTILTTWSTPPPITT